MVLVKPLTVHWHQDSAPIYSACFQPREQHPPSNRSTRLITAGGDNNARIWRLKLGADPQEMPSVEYYATLDKHERAVNVVAFDPSGQVLASAGDDGVVCLWALNELSGPEQPFGAEYEDLESWRLVRKCRTASFGEIYDLAWSPSGRYLAATSMDKVVSILDTTDGTCVSTLRDHKHYVQGVSWDPLNEYLATQSSDQRVLIYPIKQQPKSISIGSPSIRLDRADIDEITTSSFHPESFSSFFRRLSFSPDGTLLVVPAGQIDSKESTSTQAQPMQAEPTHLKPPADPALASPESTQTNLEPNSGPEDSTQSASQSATQPATQPPTQINCALVYKRSDLRRPAATLPLPKSSLAVQFCPTLFKLRNSSGPKLIDLPYRMVFAVATLNGVFIYDTEQLEPVGMASNLHYSTITDLAWSPDGLFLLLTSIDGFCSLFKFGRGELGELYEAAPAPAAPESSPAAPIAPALNEPARPAINILPARKKQKPAQDAQTQAPAQAAQAPAPQAQTQTPSAAVNHEPVVKEETVMKEHQEQTAGAPSGATPVDARNEAPMSRSGDTGVETSPASASRAPESAGALSEPSAGAGA